MKNVLFSGLFALLFSGILTNCKKTQESSPSFNSSLGDTIEIGFQQTATIIPGDFKVFFDSVISDSRCPLNVVCVWAGRADARLKFTLGQATATDTLGVGSEGAPWSPNEADILGYHVRLIDILPYPSDPNFIPPADYKVKVVVTQ